MRRALLLAVLLVCGCVGQTGPLQNIMNVQLVQPTPVEDVQITAKMPEFARVGSEFNWQIVVQPKRDIRNFTFEIYDQGPFENLTAQSFHKDLIKANATEIFTIRYRLPKTMLDSANIKFHAFYDSNATISTSVIVLSETEYFQRKAQGKLGELPISAYATSCPLKLTVSWSDMPLLDKQELQMYVDYQNIGSGYIYSLKPGHVRFVVPSNLQFKSCDDYRYEDGMLVLNRQLDMPGKKAKRSTCTFTANAEQPIDTKSIIGWAQYRYEIDSSVQIPIIKK